MLRIILSSIIGTSLMTIYSYWEAERQREQFEEPMMLNKLIHRATSKTFMLKPSILPGWILHYSIGGLFNIVYDQFWKYSSLQPGVPGGFLLGVPSGLLGMAAWASVLHLHPDPPKTHLANHLKQLFTAHLIFGITSALTYRLVHNINRPGTYEV
ncbi:hypothetical protein [Christiangramia sp.]|uniref:hypothetical protein n=1 Tax=Christiangramia sp. TaxID=1931228 RepID=UPI002616C78A|nr:hypothetical protein [Christiangramia sp.]